MRAGEYKDNPDVKGKSMAVTSKIFGARWRTLLPEEKKPYIEKSKRMKEEILARNIELGIDVKKPKVVSDIPTGFKVIRDEGSNAQVYVNIISGRGQWNKPTEEDALPMLPIAARNALTFYVKELKDSDEYVDMKTSQELYKHLDEGEKKRLNDLAKADRERHKNEMQAARTAWYNKELVQPEAEEKAAEEAGGAEDEDEEVDMSDGVGEDASVGGGACEAGKEDDGAEDSFM